MTFTIFLASKPVRKNEMFCVVFRRWHKLAGCVVSCYYTDLRNVAWDFRFFFLACAICTAFYSHPLTNRVSTVRELQWVFRLKISQLCHHVCRSCTPWTVLLAILQILFSQSEGEKKRCSFTATLIRRSACHLLSTTSSSVWQGGINIFWQACLYRVLFSER